LSYTSYAVPAHIWTAYAALMHSIAWVTRSQAVARIADRTAPQHLSGSRDVIGHVSIWFPRWSFPIGGFLEPSLYL